jgi:hypothetical protein
MILKWGNSFCFGNPPFKPPFKVDYTKAMDNLPVIMDSDNKILCVSSYHVIVNELVRLLNKGIKE